MIITEYIPVHDENQQDFGTKRYYIQRKFWLNFGVSTVIGLVSVSFASNFKDFYLN